MTDLTEEVARALASELGDDFDHAFVSKTGWVAERGEKGGRYRDINEPFQGDYLAAAQAAIAIVLERAAEVARSYVGDRIGLKTGAKLEDAILALKPEEQS